MVGRTTAAGCRVGQPPVEDPVDPGVLEAVVLTAQERQSHQAGATSAPSVWPMIRPGSAPGVSGWISHSASVQAVVEHHLHAREAALHERRQHLVDRRSPDVSISARTTASSAHIAAPWAISGGHAWAASPMMIVRPRNHGESTQIASIHW